MRLIDADELRTEFEWCREESTDKERWDDVIERLDCQQTVEDASSLDSTEAGIISKFRVLYARGLEDQYIKNPLAWALYHTWVYYDNSRGKSEEKR